MNSDYFVVNPSKAPLRAPGTNVGREHDAIVSSLSEAMEKLDDVEKQFLTDTDLNPERATSIIHLLGEMSGCISRSAAAIRIADFIAENGRNVQVRFAVGAGTLQRLRDRRLGWLGPESSLHDEYSKKWVTPTDEKPEEQTNTVLVFRRRQEIAIHLQQPDGKHKYVFWIQGDGKQSENAFQWLNPAWKALGDVLWSRPKRGLIKWRGLGSRATRFCSLLGILVLLFAVWPVGYRVACVAKVETVEERLIAAPFAAMLEQSYVQPGDRVAVGELLVKLDGRSLRLELEALHAEIQQVSKERNAALATHQIAEAQQLALKIRRLDRQKELVMDRLGRLDVTSPIDGVVISGELDKFVGAPLERGQGLLEIAPMAEMRIEVQIPDYEIGYVKPGTKTAVKLDAVGGPSMHLRIEDIFPSAELRDDQNVFIGQIRVENTDGTLRPGMLGEATAFGPPRPRVWSWVRPVFERGLWWLGY